MRILSVIKKRELCRYYKRRVCSNIYFVKGTHISKLSGNCNDLVNKMTNVVNDHYEKGHNIIFSDENIH